TGAKAEIRVGVAREKITPETPIWMSGYAFRNRPSEGIIHDIWVKALVIEENSKKPIIIVTADVIGLSHEISQEVIRRATDKYGISRSQILLNSSHTHSAPVIWPSLGIMYNLSDSDFLVLVKYSDNLIDKITKVIDSAMNNLVRAQIFTGHGSADFAINRRELTEKGVIIGLNPAGPSDHDVPVIKFETTEGKLLAVLFGYACHNTTLGDYQINGDYAGFAQIELEKEYPDAIAMFMIGCGADQNPNPRKKIEFAESHGKSLALSVQKVLEGDLQPVHLPIRTAFTTVTLEFPSFNPSRFKKELEEGDIYQKRRAKFLLESFDRGYDVSNLTYPVQAIRFDNDLTILALAGEVVVDYSLNAKKRYPEENLFVAGYSNEVPCYIPSLRVLREGGYEPETSMVYYGLPGPFKENVEEKIFNAIDEVMKQTRARK
ncbi:MAG: hypothetical protein QG576_172, partial [Bacteroidota bacterium]|nr:hypothetical protein [Bacteroidota bacterium]